MNNVTTREQDISEILTENLKHFEKIKWIKARNPFEKK